MNKQRFLVFVIVVLVILTIVGLAWVFFTAPPDTGRCSPLQQEKFGTGFKGDVLVLGGAGAVFAFLLYLFMIRYQIFFPGPDTTRFVTAAVGGAAFALVLTLIVFFSGPSCLAAAVDSESVVGEDLPSLLSLTGRFVGNLWIAILLDQLLFSVFSTSVAKFVRLVSLRG